MCLVSLLHLSCTSAYLFERNSIETMASFGIRTHTRLIMRCVLSYHHCRGQSSDLVFTAGVASLVVVVDGEGHLHQGLLPLLLEELLEPDFLLVDRQDGSGVHPGRQASRVATLLALPASLDRHLKPDC